jgi:hypothetical protein
MTSVVVELIHYISYMIYNKSIIIFVFLVKRKLDLEKLDEHGVVLFVRDSNELTAT